MKNSTQQSQKTSRRRFMQAGLLGLPATLLIAGTEGRAQQAGENVPAKIVRDSPVTNIEETKARFKINFARCQAIGTEVRRTRKLSDADFDYLVSLLVGKFTIGEVSQALDVFVGTKRAKLTPRQKEIFGSTISRLLREDDLAFDPDGYIKANLAHLIREDYQEQRFLPIMDSLSDHDPRDYVRGACGSAYVVLSRKK